MTKTRFAPKGSPLDATQTRRLPRSASFASLNAHSGQVEEKPPVGLLYWTAKLPVAY